MIEKPETDTSILKRLFPGWRAYLAMSLRRVTLPALWSVSLVIIGAVITGSSRVIHDESNINDLSNRVQKLESQQELLQKIDHDLTRLDEKVNGIKGDLDQQIEWRNRVEDVAEIPPHARRKVR